MIHRAGDWYRSIVGNLAPVRRDSRFAKEGTLTHEEFVEAGEQLTGKFPTWQWASGNPSNYNSNLPEGKQYLITRGVACKDRVRALDFVLQHKTRMEDDWTLPETVNSGHAQEGEVQDLAELGAGTGAAGSAAAAPAQTGPIIVADEGYLDAAADGEGVPDLSDLNAFLVEEDPAARAAAAPGGGPSSASGSSGLVVAAAPEDGIVRTRTYDLSITYDKYYQTPRLWLFGYDENHKPLTPEQVYEDVLSEYVKKTVTVDPHPHEGTYTASIHPCKHALVMQKVNQDWIEKGLEPRHDLALFVFLKFISGIVPTINYDFTMDIEL